MMTERTTAHRLPRGRTRDRRHAHRGRRPRAQGLDHPARAGARRDVRRARERPLQLPRAGGYAKDQGRARRTRRRGGRLRRDEHRRGVGYPAADGDRPPDGRPLGHEPGDRPGRGDPEGRRGAVPSGAAEVSPDTQRLIDDEVRSIVDESHARSCAPAGEPQQARLLADALLEHETLDEEDAYAAAGVSRPSRPAATRTRLRPARERTSSSALPRRRVRSAVGRASRRSSGIGCPLSIERP